MGANLSEESPTYSDDEESFALTREDFEDLHSDDEEMLFAEPDKLPRRDTSLEGAGSGTGGEANTGESAPLDTEGGAEGISLDEDVREKETASPEYRRRFHYRLAKKKVVEAGEDDGRPKPPPTIIRYIPGISNRIYPPPPKPKEEEPPGPLEKGEMWVWCPNKWCALLELGVKCGRVWEIFITY